MSGFSGFLKDGREIYIPRWPVNVAFENLGKAGQYLGVDNFIRISEKNTAAFIVAITSSSDPALAAALVKHFVCTVRIDDKKLNPAEYDANFESDLALVAELFCLVAHAVYSDFFVSGLVKESSPST